MEYTRSAPGEMCLQDVQSRVGRHRSFLVHFQMAGQTPGPWDAERGTPANRQGETLRAVGVTEPLEKGWVFCCSEQWSCPSFVLSVSGTLCARSNDELTVLQRHGSFT